MVVIGVSKIITGFDILADDNIFATTDKKVHLDEYKESKLCSFAGYCDLHSLPEGGTTKPFGRKWYQAEYAWW